MFSCVVFLGGGVQRYVASQADIPDRSYDGHLGQLVDGLRGPDEFRNHETDVLGESTAVQSGNWIYVPCTCFKFSHQGGQTDKT